MIMFTNIKLLTDITIYCFTNTCKHDHVILIVTLSTGTSAKLSSGCFCGDMNIIIYDALAI